MKKILGEKTKAWRMNETTTTKKKNRTDDGAPAAAASGRNLRRKKKKKLSLGGVVKTRISGTIGRRLRDASSSSLSSS